MNPSMTTEAPDLEQTELLDDLDEAAREERFDALQRHLPEVWRLWRQDDPLESVVVVPSMSIDRMAPTAGAMAQALEERLRFLLLLLRQPRLRMIYVTSMPINDKIVEYYLSLLPGVIPSHARSRLSLVSVGDSSTVPLTDKLLARPRLLAHVASLIPDAARSHLIPYNSTWRERDLALVLGIPMYAADPRHFPLGTKTGCRRAFAEAGVTYPFGAEDLHSVDDVVDALLDLHTARPAAEWAMVKLNEGASGSGNALVDLRELPAAGDVRAVVTDRDRGMQLESSRITLDTYLKRLADAGGIVEERIVGDEVRSPSVQMAVTPLGELDILSTHDQILGGPSGQVYLGARFPADPAYAATILAWVEAGGVYAVANLRGGSEEGEAWHRAGMREHKQNVFDDFHAAAEELIRGRWTEPRQLAISGGSNGGLLVGAALTQRPELYAAVVCSAPLLDMVRYEQFGLGRTWNDEYGTAADPTELDWLLSYSPYHHVIDSTAYPAVLFTVFDSDTRVDPFHARKLCAALQHATSSDRPVLLRRETDVGHGARALSRSIDLSVDTLSFLARWTGLRLPDAEDSR